MTRFDRYFVPLAIFVVVAALYIADGFAFIENELIDARFRTTPHAASDEVVVVAIDPDSLSMHPRWPWPRSEHARMIDRLDAMGARQIVLDIDLSTASSEVEDTALAASMAAAANKVVLPVFTQQRSGPEGNLSLSYTEPLRLFRSVATLALATLRPDPDGLIRRVPTIESWRGTVVPSIAGALSPAPGEQPRTMYVDFGIRPETFPVVSYVDVAEGRVGSRVFAGKRVIIGPTASQLGTHVPVPVWRAMPATVVHALAADSLIQGRALQRPPLGLTLAVTAGIILGLWFLAQAVRPLTFALACLGTICAAHATSVLVYLAWPLLIDAVPWSLGALITMAASLIGNVERQRDRLLAQAVALRRSSRFLSLVLNAINEGMVTTDGGGRIRTANANAARMFACTTHELVGRDIASLFAFPREGHASGQALIRQLISGAVEREMMGQRTDGAQFPIEVQAREMAPGGRDAFVVMVQDLSERHRTQEQLSALERLLFDAIESFGEPFAVFDRDERLVLCNSAFRDLHDHDRSLTEPGTPYEDLLRSFADHGRIDLSPGRRAEWLRDRLASFRSDARVSALTVAISDGRWFRVLDRRTGDGGKIIALIDVSAAKRREIELTEAKAEAELANHAKTAFLANMSHELRTPLNAVMGFSDMIAREMMGPLENRAYRDYGRLINQSAGHLLTVIDDILDMSRIEMASLALNESDLDLSQIIDDTLNRFSSRAGARDVTLANDSPPQSVQMRGDRRLIKQLLTHLVSNAVKFSHPGGAVSVAANPRRDGGIDLVVRDRGIGIQPERIEDVLSPFGQIEGALTRSHEGVGLGLPLARRFAEAHGAQLEIDSRPGAGTVVTVSFPASRVTPLLAAGE